MVFDTRLLDGYMGGSFLDLESPLLANDRMGMTPRGPPLFTSTSIVIGRVPKQENDVGKQFIHVGSIVEKNDIIAMPIAVAIDKVWTVTQVCESIIFHIIILYYYE